VRATILIVALLGTLLFGSAFVLSYTNPAYVESIGKDLIRLEVERRVGEKIAALDRSTIARVAEKLSGQNAVEIAEAKRMLAEGLPQKIAAAIAEMRNLDCECRKAIDRRITGILEGRVSSLSLLNDRLMLLIRTKYIETAEALTREFRVVTGANASVFMLLGVIAMVRRPASLQLLLPTAVLLIAAAATALLYLFNQNWLHTVVYADYLGLGYFIYLGLAIALLADIAFNSARVTTRLLNAALHLFGSALQAVPC
jgi:hypothetical protein